MPEDRRFGGEAETLSDPASRTERQIEFDRLFSLLSKDRRRYALYCLSETSAETLSTGELVDELVALERRTSDVAAPRSEIELSLRHTHLPKLSAADVVDYDADRSAATYRGGPRVDRWIDRAMDAELPGPSE